MSRRPSPPRDYGYRGYRPPERSSTGNLYPVQPQSTHYPPKYTSPRSSGERVSGSTTLASIENYDRSGRRVSTYTPAPSAFRDPRGSTSGSNGFPSRRLSLNTAQPRAYEPRYPPTINHTPTSATRGPERDFDRESYYQKPVSSLATRNGHGRQSSSIEDTQRTRQFDERRRDLGYDPPRRRRDSQDMERPDRRGYHLSGAKHSRADERASYEYNPGRERSARTGEPRHHDRSESLELGPREKPKQLALEYPGHQPKPSRDAGPPTATRGLERLNGMSRSESVRDPRSRSPPVPLARGRGPSPDANEDYPVPRRRRPQSESYARPPSPTITSPIRNGFHGPSESVSSSRKHDPEIASRGFGLRAPSAEPPRDRSDRFGVIPAGVLKQREANAAPRDEDLYPNDARRSRPLADGKYGDRQVETDVEPRANDRRSNHDRSSHSSHIPPEAATAVAGGAAAFAAGEIVSNRRDKDEDSDERRRRDRRGPRPEQGHSRETSANGQPSSTAMPSRPKDVNHGSSQDLPGASFKNAPITTTNDEDDYQARMQRELERLTQAKAGASVPSKLKPPPQQASRRERSPAAEERSPTRSAARSRYEPQHSRETSRDVSPARGDGPQAVTTYKPPTVEPVTNEPWSAEPDEMPMSPTGGAKRIAIVEPPPEEKKPKGILKQRTEPFPTYAPEPREGARPYKEIEGAPKDATMTRVPKSAYSTTVLKDHSERFYVYFDDAKGFEMICILRVLPKDILDKYRAQSDPKNSAYEKHIQFMKRKKEEEEELERKELQEEEEREKRAAHQQQKDKDDDDEDEKQSGHSSRPRHKHRHRSSRRSHDDSHDASDSDDSDEDRDRRPKQKAIEY